MVTKKEGLSEESLYKRGHRKVVAPPKRSLTITLTLLHPIAVAEHRSPILLTLVLERHPVIAVVFGGGVNRYFAQLLYVCFGYVDYLRPCLPCGRAFC